MLAKMKKIINIVLLGVIVLPSIAFGAAFEGTQGLITAFGGIVGSLLPIVAGLALLYFFWGLAKFILRAGEEKGREEGKQIMMWGIIALFVMVSIWGIVGFISDDLFGVGNGGSMPNPSGTYDGFEPGDMPN